jgi:hypothetical protein
MSSFILLRLYPLNKAKVLGKCVVGLTVMVGVLGVEGGGRREIKVKRKCISSP